MNPAARAKTIALSAAAAMLLSCSAGERLVRLVLPVERPDIELTAGGSALIRSVSCDIMVEPVDDALWAKLGRTRAYTRRPAPGARRRVPPLAAFHLIIKSTTGSPLRLKGARIVSGNTVLERLTAAALQARLRSPAYSAYDLAGLASYRRLAVDTDSARWIDYDRETLASTFDFIPPSDSVVTLLFFERPPAGDTAFRLTLELSASGASRSVSCDFTARDYRAGDREYRKLMSGRRMLDEE